MPVETPVRRRRRVRPRPRLIPCLLALVAVLLVIKWIDPFAPGERPLPETPDWITVELLYEFAPGLTVLVAQRDHSFVKLPLSELLTHGFGPKSLG